MVKLLLRNSTVFRSLRSNSSDHSQMKGSQYIYLYNIPLTAVIIRINFGLMPLLVTHLREAFLIRASFIETLSIKHWFLKHLRNLSMKHLSLKDQLKLFEVNKKSVTEDFLPKCIIEAYILETLKAYVIEPSFSDVKG